MVAQVSDWLQRWTEPTRLRSRHAALEHFNRNASWFGITTSPFLRDWYRPFSELVRSRPPLPRGAGPFLFESINYVQFRFAVIETGDTSSLVFAGYTRKNRAKVTITEIEFEKMTNVTIREIEPGF